jgi:outer membrane receptor protein involved in Fe transport
VPANSAYGLPPLFSHSLIDMPVRAYSLFGQLRYDILPELELAGGVRWTDETRKENPIDFITGKAVVIPVQVPRIHSDNYSPEFTVTYRPTDDLTVYGSYKQAYKSGSYTLADQPAPHGNNAFNDERVRGGEIGLKSLWLDHTLQINLAGYYDHYAGLQVGAVQPSKGGQFLTHTVNAGAARSYGIDLDVTYLPPSVDGLTLHGTVDWDNARYIVLNNVPCWGGQTIAAGCNQLLNAATGLYTAQSLNGTPMFRAPEWQMNFGFDYEFPIGNYSLTLSNSNYFTTRYVTDLAVGRPNEDNYQPAYFKTDLSLSLQSPNDRWEFAVIGKNLSDVISSGHCSTANFAAGAIFGGEITGGTGVGPAGIDEVVCNMDPGREVWIRLTLKAS